MRHMITAIINKNIINVSWFHVLQLQTSLHWNHWSHGSSMKWLGFEMRSLWSSLWWIKRSIITKTHATTTHAATKHVSIEKTHNPWKYHKRLQAPLFAHGTLTALVGCATAAALLSVVIHVASIQATCLCVFARRAIARRIVFCFHLRQLTRALTEPAIRHVVFWHGIWIFDTHIMPRRTVGDEHSEFGNVVTRNFPHKRAFVLAIRTSIVRARAILSWFYAVPSFWLTCFLPYITRVRFVLIRAWSRPPF